MRRSTLAASLVSSCVSLSLILSACGSGDPTTEGTIGTGPTAITQQPDAAADPSIDQFPAAGGRTLEQVAKEARPGTNFAPGTGTYVPGENRIAFGLLNDQNEILYAPTAVYVARTPASPAKGPFLAPADSLVTEPPYRSQNAASDSDPFASIYAADVELPEAGNWSVLVLSDTGDGLIGATEGLRVAAKSPIPQIGDLAPVVSTDTVGDVSDISKIDTRTPPDDMHGVDAADVIGEKPVALLFATPALCESRVCGPVTDIAEQLRDEYGDQVEFIHQEVYVDNDPSKGLRQPLLDFRLRSEPWLFTIDAEGRVTERLEGSFGVGEFEEAVNAAIDG